MAVPSGCLLQFSGFGVNGVKTGAEGEFIYGPGDEETNLEFQGALHDADAQFSTSCHMSSLCWNKAIDLV